MDVSAQARKIADMAGVDESAVMTLASMVVSQLEADDADQLFVDESEGGRVELAQAYAQDAAKKIKKMAITYKSNPDAERAVQQYVYRLVAG